jgi:hypothetical protein
MKTDSEAYAQLIAQRQKEAHEREAQAKAWAADVTQQLTKEHSKFLLEFTQDEKRIFGVIDESL